MLCYLAEITVYDPGISGTRVLYYSTLGYTSKPTDTPANQHYEARIIQPAVMRRDVFSQGTTGGASTTGYGLIELANLGDLDALMDYGMDGRSFRLLLGEHNAAYSSYTVVMQGTMEQPEFTWSKLSIRLRDRLAELDKPCQSVLFAGTNAGPVGLEGLPGDLQGKPKPKVFGQVFNVAPPLANASLLIYQVSDGLVSSVDGVYDGGGAVSAGSAYSSVADMQTNAPAAGYYRVYASASGSYFRLGSSPSSQITADVTQGASAANRTAAQVLAGLAQLSGTVTAADLVSADLTALDTASGSAVVGIWLANAENIKTAMDEVANSVGAWYGFDRVGRLRMAQLSLPGGSPVASFDYYDTISVERTASGDASKGIPVWQVALGYQKNYTVQTVDYRAGMSADRMSFLQQEFRTASVQDASIKTVHLLAPVISANTLLVSASAASAEAARRLSLYGSRRELLTARVRVVPGVTASLDLGDVVQLTMARVGFESGKLLRVIGIQPDYRTGTIDLTLWG